MYIILVILEQNNNSSHSYEDIHNSWLYCFTNPLEIGTRVLLSHRQPYVWTHMDDAHIWLTMRKRTRVPISRGLMKKYYQELCISSQDQNSIVTRRLSIPSNYNKKKLD